MYKHCIIQVFGVIKLILMGSLLVACEDDDPNVSLMAGEINAGEINAGEINAGEINAGEINAGEINAGEMGTQCTQPDSDYPSGTWDMCISDRGRYELAGANTPSSAARVAAYEAIADLLWRNDNMTAEDFVQAELIYGEDGGVGSRVTRRYDAHLPPPEGADCAQSDASELWPEYCIGPSTIEPMILRAFAEGNSGTNMAENSAKVKAGLLWFFYVSTYKEAYTCAGKSADCDSHWAYCNGAKQLDETPFGLGAEIRNASEEAYIQLFNAHLAVRCWRDIDQAEVAENTALHEQVLGQLDRALDYGYALMISTQLKVIAESNRSDSTDLVVMGILGPTLSRAAQVKDQTLNEMTWTSQWNDLNPESAGILADQINTLFECP